MLYQMGKVSMIKIILISIVFLIWVGSYIAQVKAQDNITQKYNGNFPTQQVRELWMLCSQTFMNKHPMLPQELRWLVCDCYTDVIRRDHTPETASNLEPIAQKDLTVTLIQECNGLLPNHDIET